jgi:hypothetical protein
MSETATETPDGSKGLDIMRAYVSGQAALGYPAFEPGPRPDDVILATFPKSGSTWTSYLLQQIRSGADDDFDDIKNEVVDITPGHWDPARQPFAEPQRFRPRTFKTHGSYTLCPKGAGYIYVGREPKDILWSLYHFIHDLLGIDEWVPLDRFYRDYFIERFGTGHDIGNVWDHILGWHPLRGEANMLWLHYEDLVLHTEPALRLLAGFMQVPLDGPLLGRLVAHAGMDHMRTIADRINPSPDNYVGRIVAGFGELTRSYAREMKFGKLRRGIPGDGSAGLPAELVQELDREWRSRITPKLGYADYAAMRAAHSPF